LFVIVAQRSFCEVPTEFLHVMQGFGRRIIIKFLNKYQFVMHFNFFYFFHNIPSQIDTLLLFPPTSLSIYFSFHLLILYIETPVCVSK